MNTKKHGDTRINVCMVILIVVNALVLYPIYAQH